MGHDRTPHLDIHHTEEAGVLPNVTPSPCVVVEFLETTFGTKVQARTVPQDFGPGGSFSKWTTVRVMVRVPLAGRV